MARRKKSNFDISLSLRRILPGMKAVIPVAGAGTKLRPHTHTQPKPMIPIAGKPILGHIIESLLEAGIEQQIFITGYLREKIQDFVMEHYGDRIEAEFVIQEPRRGLAHAIWMARESFRDTDEILIVLGDTLFGEDIRNVLKIPGCALGVQEVDDPRAFGVAIREHGDEHVIQVIEKPEIPTSNLALVGLYKICRIPELIESLDEVVQKPVGEDEEYVLTNALMGMINRGVRFSTYFIENWYDCGKLEGLLRTNRILLERLGKLPQYSFDNSVIIPPVLIQRGCQISNSIIGPNVAISENSRIRDSIIRNSILGAFTQLDSIILRDSVIGNDTSLIGKANSINIGDNTEIDLGS
jgi:glucose-1-phosphate thymidylyltransferase